MAEHPYSGPPPGEAPATPHYDFPAPAVGAGAFATWGDRLGAAVLDALVRVGIVAVPGAIGAIAFVGGEEAGTAGLGLGVFVGLLVALAYAPVMIARTGQTLGHRAVDIKVVRGDGSRVGGGRAFVREVVVKALLMENLALFTAYLLTLINYLWPLWDPRNQALHDKMCDTLVLKTA